LSLTLTLAFAAPEGSANPLPSILGRDVIDHFRLVVDRTNGVVELDDPAKYLAATA
jgi:hypothetical protein